MGEAKSFWTCVLIASIAKLLMLKSYRSTDFEVHRNWLAITHSLPLHKWYYEDTSEWTLDYPPFFAYFEWMLSYGALLFDGKMLNVTNLNYASNMTIFYQKLTVVVTDFVLAYGVFECSTAMPLIMSKTRKKSETSYATLLFGLVFINGGLFMVDHIHFQYNGFLFGILMLSLAKICKGKCYQGAFLFASLLSLKHIFLYIAPAIGIYLLRTWCIKTDRRGVPRSINLKSLFTFGGIVGSVAGLAFGPFYQHIPQILNRLFPFQRGLSHAYWAPNIWAAYNSLDLVLGYGLNQRKSGATSGLVGESSLAILPTVKPIHTFVITLFGIMPLLWKLWRNPSPTSFIYAVTLTAWTSFMFGYHVHEKAILNVIIPFSLIALLNQNLFFVTLAAGTVSLFPLLFTPFEIVVKAVLAVFHLSVASQIVRPCLKWYQTLYILGFLPVYIFENLGDALIPKFPFLPLLVVSDYTLVGIAACYISLYWKYIVTNEKFIVISKEEEENESYNSHVTEENLVTLKTTTKTNQKVSNISPRVLRKRK